MVRHSYVGHAPQAAQTYVEADFFAADPCVLPMINALNNHRYVNRTSAQVVLLSQMPGWNRTAYAREFLEPFNVGDVLGLGIPVYSAFETTMMCVGFHRVSNEGFFGTAEVARLTALVPVLESIFMNLAYAEALMLSGGMLSALAHSHSDSGAVILDNDLILRHANQQGVSHLGLRENASIPDTGIFAALRERLMSMEKVPLHKQSFTLSPYDIEVEVKNLEGATGETIYLLLTQQTGDTQKLARVCQSYNLSVREIEIVKLICSGQSNAAISVQLGIALRTVENHLRSVYAKASVNSRAQLMSRLMTIN